MTKSAAKRTKPITQPLARAKFLSDEWFARVDALIAAAGDLAIPEALRDARVNITVQGAKTVTKVHFKDGHYKRGHDDSCRTQLTLPENVARKFIIDGESSAAVQAFFEGKIFVEGELQSLLVLQTVEPSMQQLRLARQIQAITA